jgi:hypothetical protein
VYQPLEFGFIFVLTNCCHLRLASGRISIRKTAVSDVAAPKLTGARQRMRTFLSITDVSANKTVDGTPKVIDSVFEEGQTLRVETPATRTSYSTPLERPVISTLSLSAPETSTLLQDGAPARR